MENSNTAKPLPRTHLHFEISFKRNYGREPVTGVIQNVSLSGAYLKHAGERLRTGEKLHVNFRLAGRERVLHAKVVWTNTKGAGVQFLHTNNRDPQIIDDLIYFIESRKSGKRDILDLIFNKVA